MRRPPSTTLFPYTTLFRSGSEHPSQWAAIASIASKLGCTPETLRRWVRQAERDTGDRSGLTTDEQIGRAHGLNFSHSQITYAVFCLKKKTAIILVTTQRPY